MLCGVPLQINAMQPIEDVFAEIEPLFEPYIQVQTSNLLYMELFI